LTTSVNSRRPSVHKRLVTPLFCDRFFRDNFVIFRRSSKRIAFLASVNFSACMKIFNFRDGHVTTLQHPSGAYICQMPDHRLSRLAKGTTSESRLSIGTIGLGVKLQNSGIFHDSTRPHHLHFDGLPPKSQRSSLCRT